MFFCNLWDGQLGLVWRWCLLKHNSCCKRMILSHEASQVINTVKFGACMCPSHPKGFTPCCNDCDGYHHDCDSYSCIHFLRTTISQQLQVNNYKSSINAPSHQSLSGVCHSFTLSPVECHASGLTPKPCIRRKRAPTQEHIGTYTSGSRVISGSEDASD